MSSRFKMRVLPPDRPAVCFIGRGNDVCTICFGQNDQTSFPEWAEHEILLR
jgi:hypothetical protein